MADTTVTSVTHFQQLRNRQDDLRRKNTAAIVEASKGAKRALLDKLIQQRVELNATDQQILEAEVAFADSGLSQTAAENALKSHTRDANRLVNAVSDIAKKLDVVGRFARILTDLVRALR